MYKHFCGYIMFIFLRWNLFEGTHWYYKWVIDQYLVFSSFDIPYIHHWNICAWCVTTLELMYKRHCVQRSNYSAYDIENVIVTKTVHMVGMIMRLLLYEQLSPLSGPYQTNFRGKHTIYSMFFPKCSSYVIKHRNTFCSCDYKPDICGTTKLQFLFIDRHQ